VGMSKQGEGLCIASCQLLLDALKKRRLLYMSSWRKQPGDAAQGVFWDGEGGCLVGAWHEGALQGAGGYHLPALSLAGSFEAGLPRGRARFVRSAATSAGEPAIAAAHLLAGARVALAHGGQYTWDAGARAPLAVHGGRMDASRPETTTQGCSASAPCAAVCMRACAGRVLAVDMHSLQRSGERW